MRRKEQRNKAGIMLELRDILIMKGMKSFVITQHHTVQLLKELRYLVFGNSQKDIAGSS